MSSEWRAPREVTAGRRLLNALAAACALILVAGVLFVFAHPSSAAGPASLRVRVESPPRGAAAAATTTAQATASTTTASTPAASTTTTSSTTPGSIIASAATTAGVAVPPVPSPEPDATHRAAVASQSFVFVDPTRPTPPAGGDAGGPSRTLPTVVRYPADGPDTGAEGAGGAGRHSGHPFPLIVFAHGYNNSPGGYAALLHSWAGAGYVVAAPSFPRGTAGGPLNESDLDNQPGDLSFVITKVLALAGPGGPLAGIVDPAHIGVAGHSDGASTTSGIGYNTCCRDARVQADAVMEGDEHPYPGGRYFPPGGEPPLLVIQADNDALNPPALGRAVYNDARGPKYLLWLVNAQHLEPYTTDGAHLAVVESVTTAFFDRYLKGRSDGLAQMRRGATQGLGTLSAG